MSIKQGSGTAFDSANATVDMSNTNYLHIEADYGIYAVPSTGGEVVVNILLTINAPKAPEQKERSSVAVALVIDKSGSMSDLKKLEYAKIAGKALVQKLEPRDKLSIVVFDAGVNVLFPIASVTNKQHIEKMIDLIKSGSTTNISGGLEAGLNQIESTKLDGTKRVVLLSDGQANVGIQNPEGIAAIAAAHRPNGISVSSIGLGVDYNENLMQLVAQRGGGQYYYCGEAEDLSTVFDNELSLAKNAVTRRTSAIIAPSNNNRCIQEIKVHGLPTKKQGNETKIEMSDLTSEEERQILLQITIDPSLAVNVDVKKEKENKKDDKKKQSQKEDQQTKEDLQPQQVPIVEQQSILPLPLSLGEIRIQFSRSEGGAAEQIEIPLSTLVVDDEDQRDQINGDESIPNLIAGSNQIGSGNRTHVQSIERVAEFLMTVEADAARTRAVEEMERGNANGARFILNQHRQRQLDVQQVAFMLQNNQDLDSQIQLRGSMDYNQMQGNDHLCMDEGSSSQVKKQNIGIQSKPRGFAAQISSFFSRKAPETAVPPPPMMMQQQQQQQQYHRLMKQTSSLKSLPQSGMMNISRRSQPREEAAAPRNLKKSILKQAAPRDLNFDMNIKKELEQEKREKSSSNNNQRKKKRSGLKQLRNSSIADLEDEAASESNSQNSSGSGSNRSSDSNNNNNKGIRRQRSSSPTLQLSFNSKQSIFPSPSVTIPKPPPIKLLPPEQQNTVQGNLNRALFLQQQGLDEIEEQLAAAEGNSAMKSHLVKQSKQRSYAHAQGKNSAAASATASSSSTVEPDDNK